MMAERVSGPAPYFPSIEAKSGRSIAVWKALMRATGLTTHKELVTWFRTENGFGHGHANALTADLLAESSPRGTDDELVDQLFSSRKAHWRPVYDELLRIITGFGPVKVLPKKTVVGIGTRSQFAMLAPATPDRFDVGLKLSDVEPTERLEPAGSWNTLMTHRVRLADAEHVDQELIGWLRTAYERSNS
jgi:hypothetical protein